MKCRGGFTCTDTESDSLLMVMVCNCPLARLLALLLNTSASLPPSSLYLTSSASSHENTHQRTEGYISDLTEKKGKLVRASERGLRLKHHYLKSFFSFFLETASSCRVIFTDGVNTLNPSKINLSTFKKCLFFLLILIY